MIVRPLELASRLRGEPSWSLDALHVVNAGLLVLFFSLFGSRFVLAPGLDIELRTMAGSEATAASTTTFISVTRAGVVFVDSGPVTMDGLKKWLAEQSAKTKDPSLLVRASKEVSVDVQADIVSAAAKAGFSVTWASDEPPPPDRADSKK